MSTEQSEKIEWTPVDDCPNCDTGVLVMQPGDGAVYCAECGCSVVGGIDEGDGKMGACGYRSKLRTHIKIESAWQPATAST